MNLIKIRDGDPFDPNNWEPSDHEHRIYADESLEIYAVVDWVDYIYLCRFKWSVHVTRVHRGDKSTARHQLYLRRSVTEFWAPDGEPYESPLSGKIVRNRHRTTRTLFLHQEVMERKGDVPPSSDHNIIDHEDRDSLNCRRSNLRWLTVLDNRQNNEYRNGKFKGPSC